MRMVGSTKNWDRNSRIYWVLARTSAFRLEINFSLNNMDIMPGIEVHDSRETIISEILVWFATQEHLDEGLVTEMRRL